MIQFNKTLSFPADVCEGCRLSTLGDGRFYGYGEHLPLLASVEVVGPEDFGQCYGCGDLCKINTCEVSAHEPVAA